MSSTRPALPVASCAAVLGFALGCTGCAVVNVAGAAAGAAISVTGSVVSAGIGVTGKVIEKTVDVVTPSRAPVPN